MPLLNAIHIFQIYKSWRWPLDKMHAQ